MTSTNSFVMSNSENCSQQEEKNEQELDINQMKRKSVINHGDLCDDLPNNNVCLNAYNNNDDDNNDCVSAISSDDMMSKNFSSDENQIGSSYSKDHVDSQNVEEINDKAHTSDYSTTTNNEVDKNPPITNDHGNGMIKKTSQRISKSNTTNKKARSTSGGGDDDDGGGGGTRKKPRKSLVAMYHSQISGDKNTIKIRIKKSNFTTHVQLTPNKKKSGRRKKHKLSVDGDKKDYEPSTKKSMLVMNGESKVTSSQDKYEEPKEQSGWSDKIPKEILLQIFHYLCLQDGCLPNLVRLSQVCKVWRSVALSPILWHKIDLNYVKEKSRTDMQLHWLILNRLELCQDLNLGEWKIRDIQKAMEALCRHCQNLQGLNLSGWNGLNADNLKYLTSECKTLQRLDLSSINSTSAINAQPLVALSQTMNNRLTHLVLAHNKMAGFTQIISSIATHCPNLQLLDISNIRTFAHNTALLHVEKLQIGCPKLKVLRITNSQIWLAPATLTDQVASPGFPMLEELSLAGLEEDQTTTSRSVDDEGIGRILKNSTKLRLLDVRGCIRLTDSGLVKIPAWDLEHLFLSACYVTRTQNSGLELIVQKWAHSLLEVDLAWSTATASLDGAVTALAEKGSESKLRVLNLCGSSVSLEPVKAVLTKCPNLHSINLQSCRGLPRGIKRLYTGDTINELKENLQDKPKSTNELENEKSSPAHTPVSVTE